MSIRDREGRSIAHATVRGAAFSTLLIFGSCGFMFATWASRIPAASTALGLSTGQTGALLLAGAVGSLISLPLAGRVCNALGPTKMLQCGGLLAAGGTAVVALGLLTRDLLNVTAGLFAVGVALGLWDVAQNLAGAQIERALGRSVMPRFHAAYSGGAFVGALAGALLSAAGVGLPAHLTGTAVALALVMYVAPQFLLGARPHSAGSVGPDRAARAWKQTRNLILGLVVLGAALTEGAGNDWIAKGAVDGLGVSQAAGALIFASFVASMTLARWFGGNLVDRYGRPWALRCSMAAALLGLMVYSLSGSPWWAVLGAVLWGAGGALAFPLGISAAADEPRNAHSAVAVVSTVGYIGFLAGPPALGFLGDLLGIRVALLAIALPIALSFLLAHSTAGSAPKASPEAAVDLQSGS